MKPSSTYRLQLNAGFGFEAAAGIADYLEALGVSHVYSSPYLQAAPGSTHGYDVVDHSKVNEELGGADAHVRFCYRLGQCHLGQILDIVPNHMAISGRLNKWWWDVLQNGPSSRFAGFFDIDWRSPEEKLRNKVLLPVLGDHYGRLLAAGELKLVRDRGMVVQYGDNIFPTAPNSVEAGITDQTIEQINHNPDQLHEILERQNYRLSYWRTAQRDLGYRRFFDVNTLVGLRMEDPRVFAATHELVLGWLRSGVIDGVRVDHPDGLRDPERYFAAIHLSAPEAYVVAEKILEPGEDLPGSWPVDGTSGYDFLNILGGLFVDSRSEKQMTQIYREFTGEQCSFHALAAEKKQLILRDLLGSDVNRLTALFLDICDERREYRDYTRHEIHHAIRELVGCFSVYRTYVRAEDGQVTADDIRYVEQAVACAKKRRADLDPFLFDLLQSVLLLRVRGELESEFVMRFQQFTGPAMAKGVEDTAYYCYNRLLSLNEVGGDPGRFGVSVDEFHRHCQNMQESWPHTMLASSTHDTKRSEDVRARISLLSEIADTWSGEVRFWSARNDRHKTNGMPDRNTEYLIYQTMIGAWPIGLDRILPYLEKAVREARQQTSWSAPNEGYEQALRSFVEGIYGDADFMNDFEVFTGSLTEATWLSALSQTLLKMTAPGVPDIYQGCEIWNFSLVDPDNRRPVDYGLRRRLLLELNNLTPAQIWERRSEGLPKLWTIRQALCHRRAFGPYNPIQVKGSQGAHAIAFHRGDAVAVVAPRLIMGLNGQWLDTCIDLSRGRWRNVLSGEDFAGGEVRFADLFRTFPAALLLRTEASNHEHLRGLGT
jgi:(1->4)-alpha-D-glucan 1-alpha-D-glucosylmutase